MVETVPRQLVGGLHRYEIATEKAEQFDRAQIVIAVEVEDEPSIVVRIGVIPGRYRPGLLVQRFVGAVTADLPDDGRIGNLRSTGRASRCQCSDANSERRRADLIDATLFNATLTICGLVLVAGGWRAREVRITLPKS